MKKKPDNSAIKQEYYAHIDIQQDTVTEKDLIVIVKWTCASLGPR